jgi:glyoxylase-like metal-dependent hydrolase (beta-lactamase superfamily II)
MRQVVPDVYLIEGLRASHVYLLVSEDGLILIDSGSPGEATQIESQLEEGGHRLSDLQTIVLTHCHADHTGSAAELARRSGAQVLAHRDEVPYIEKTEALPASSFVRRLLDWVSDRVFRTAACQVDRALEDGDVVDALGGLQVIHAPGHTPGNIALYGSDRRILFCGDTIFNGNPFSGRGGIGPPPRAFSLDTVQAEASARKVAELPVEVVCFGHGEPILEQAGERLRQAVRWDMG